MGKPTLAPAVPLEGFFAGRPLARAVFDAVRDRLEAIGPVEVRASRSQVAFRRRRGFAFLWLPGQYLPRADVEVVLAIGLDHRDPSPRFKEVVHPAPGVWLHHLEVRALDDVDDEVGRWLAESAEERG